MSGPGYARWLLALWVGLAPEAAHAGGQFELFGANPRGKGMAGAQTASTEDSSAAYYNPAGLAEMKSAQTFAALAGNINAVYVDLETPLSREDWKRPSLPPNYGGLDLGVGLPLGGKVNRFVFGITGFAPQRRWLSVRTLDPAQPHFFFWEAQPDRVEVMPALALRATEFIKVGVGMRLAGGIRGPLSTDVDLFQGRSTRKVLTGELHYVLAPTGGVILGPFWGFRIGATARGPLSVPVNLPVDANLEGLDASVFMQVRTMTNFTPPTASVGISWQGFGDHLTLSLDLQYSWWSLANDPSVQVGFDPSGDDLELLGLDAALDVPRSGHERKARLGLRDILVPRAGFEWRLFEDILRFRGGAYLRPTPVPNQTSGSNYLDSTSFAVTGGAAVRITDPFGFIAHPLSVEGNLQSITLTERTVTKKSQDDPVGNYRFGGQIHELSAGVSYVF